MTKSMLMITRAQWRRFIDLPVVEWSIFGLGLLMMILSPLAGAIPGPGGIFVFAIGLAMVLKTSMWAKRRYVRFKRQQPKAGRWMDWGLRRRSALRRERLKRELEGPASDGEAPPAAIGQSPVQPAGAAPIDTPPQTGRSDEARPN